MERQELREELKRLALDEDESDVYLALLSAGPSKARTVAEEADIHRTTAYRILKALADRGLVEVGVGRPMKFTPSPPDRFFEGIRREKARELEEVDEVEKKVGDHLERLRADEGAEADERWRLIKGQGAIVEEALERIAGAEEEFRYLSTEPGGGGRQDVDVDWRKPLADAAPRLDARILVDPESRPKEILDELLDMDGLDVRFTESDARAQSALIDGESFVWIVVSPDEPSEDVALWSNASHLYTSQRLLFDGLWESARRPEGS